MYKLYAITQGEKTVDMSRPLPGVVPPGTMGNIAYYMYVIKGEGRTILVDTGMDDEHTNKFKIKGTKFLIESLNKVGVDPAKVDNIILSHLHADHFSGHEIFTKAIFWLQKREVEFFQTGAKFRQVSEFSPNMAKLEKLIQDKRVKLLDGDTEFATGIRLVLIGGHTPGSQVVVVSTEAGDVVLCADALDLYRMLDDKVFGMYVDLMPALLGLEKLKTLASSPKLIIPGHDPLVMKNFPNIFEGVAEIG
jgi:glyoxylase-like metal-dependent hydrolase (beta-lactamase superfamily II)